MPYSALNALRNEKLFLNPHFKAVSFIDFFGFSFLRRKKCARRNLFSRAGNVNPNSVLMNREA